MATDSDSDAARGERMRYRIDAMLAEPWSFLPSYADRYALMRKHAEALTPHQAYAMTGLLGRDSSHFYPDMPQTAELQFPKVNAVDAQSQVGWYYFAGHVEATDGTRYGILFMLFRNALMPPVMAQHFGLNDIDNQLVEVQFAIAVGGGKFYQADPPVTAGTSGKVKLADTLTLVTEGGSVEGSSGDSPFPLRLRGNGTDRSGEKPVEMALDLTIASARPYLLQGFDGAEPLIGGMGTRYYSIPGLAVDAAKSTLTIDGKTINLKSGTMWFDHQWGLGLAPNGSPRHAVLRASANLNSTLSAGWDFFVANLDGPYSLTLNSIHDADSLKFMNQTGPQPQGTMHAAVVGKFMDRYGVQFNVSGTLDIDQWRKTGPAPNPAKYPNTPTWVPHHWIFRLTEGVVPIHLRKLEARAICDDANALQFANGSRYVEAALDYYDAAGKAVGTGYAEAVGYVDARIARLSLAGLPTTPEVQALFAEPKMTPSLWLESFIYMLSPANQAELKRLGACAQFAPGPRPLNCGAAPPGPAAAPTPVEAQDILAALKKHFGMS